MIYCGNGKKYKGMGLQKKIADRFFSLLYCTIKPTYGRAEQWFCWNFFILRGSRPWEKRGETEKKRPFLKFPGLSCTNWIWIGWENSQKKRQRFRWLSSQGLFVCYTLLSRSMEDWLLILWRIYFLRFEKVVMLNQNLLWLGRSGVSCGWRRDVPCQRRAYAKAAPRAHGR